VLSTIERLLGPEHPDTATFSTNLGALYYAQEKYEQSEPLLQRALAIREQILGSMHSDTIGSFNNLAELYQAQEKYEQAISLYQRALETGESLLGLDHPQVITLREAHKEALERLKQVDREDS
jgi:tetratricopeptide (TPR) repeat protein